MSASDDDQQMTLAPEAEIVVEVTAPLHNNKEFSEQPESTTTTCGQDDNAIPPPPELSSDQPSVSKRKRLIVDDDEQEDHQTSSSQPKRSVGGPSSSTAVSNQKRQRKINPNAASSSSSRPIHYGDGSEEENEEEEDHQRNAAPSLKPRPKSTSSATKKRQQKAASSSQHPRSRAPKPQQSSSRSKSIFDDGLGEEGQDSMADDDLTESPSLSDAENSPRHRSVTPSSSSDLPPIANSHPRLAKALQPNPKTAQSGGRSIDRQHGILGPADGHQLLPTNCLWEVIVHDQQLPKLMRIVAMLDAIETKGVVRMEVILPPTVSHKACDGLMVFFFSDKSKSSQFQARLPVLVRTFAASIELRFTQMFLGIGSLKNLDTQTRKKKYHALVIGRYLNSDLLACAYYSGTNVIPNEDATLPLIVPTENNHQSFEIPGSFAHHIWLDACSNAIKNGVNLAYQLSANSLKFTIHRDKETGLLSLSLKVADRNDQHRRALNYALRPDADTRTSDGSGYFNLLEMDDVPEANDCVISNMVPLFISLYFPGYLVFLRSCLNREIHHTRLSLGLRNEDTGEPEDHSPMLLTLYLDDVKSSTASINGRNLTTVQYCLAPQNLENMIMELPPLPPDAEETAHHADQ